MASVEVVRPLEESVPDEGGGGPCQVGDVDGQGYGQDGSHDCEGGDSQDREDEDEVHRSGVELADVEFGEGAVRELDGDKALAGIAHGADQSSGVLTVGDEEDFGEACSLTSAGLESVGVLPCHDVTPNHCGACRGPGLLVWGEYPWEHLLGRW